MFSANGLSFTKIIIAIGRTDMRRGIDGLSASVRLRYGLDPLDPGTLFLFCGIRKDRIILVKLNSCRRQVFSLTAYTAETNLARQLNSFASIESRFPNSKVMIYNGQIIALLFTLQGQPLPKEYIEITKALCLENELYAGMSNCFANIMDFASYYKQALRAIELGGMVTDKPGLFSYADFYLEHIKSLFLQKESAEVFCHPAMKLLFEYDKAHNSSLAYTLYMFLKHERNLSSAAEERNMHRTSLVYRFQKIKELIGDDFEDYKMRVYLLMSYEMMKEAAMP